MKILWAEIVALGLGVMKTTDIVKEVFDRTTGMNLQPYLKSVVATGLSVGAAVSMAHSWRERLVLAGGIAGTAAALHEGYAVLSTKADANKAQVVQIAARKSMSAQTATAPSRRVPAL